MNKIQIATDIICQEEGFRAQPYIDTLGYPTVGYGHKIGKKGQPLDDFSAFPPIPEPVAKLWAQHHVVETFDAMSRNPDISAAFSQANDARAAILISMAYQMGTSGLAQFKQTLSDMAGGDFILASQEMLDSRWAKQTPNRAERHAQVIESGELGDAYKA